MKKQKYNGNGKHEWEAVSGDDILGVYTYRLRVAGGWLYGVQSEGEGIGFNTVTFVPMPEVTGHVI